MTSADDEPMRGHIITNTTLRPHVDRYLAQRRALGTYNGKSLAAVRYRLVGFSDHFGRRPLNQLTRRAVVAWQESIGHLSVNTRAAYLGSVRTFTRWLTLERIIDHDPCLEVPGIRRPRTVPRAQTADAVAAILAACADDRETAIIWLMVGLGLRRAEVAGLRWEDIDHRARAVTVRGKGGHERVLPVTTEVEQALARLRLTTGPVIRSRRDGGHLTPLTVGIYVRRIMDRAGVKRQAWDGVSAHALRHTAASDVLDSCGELRVVQQMLGHANLATTAIYLRRASAAQIRDAMEGRTYPAGQPPPPLRRVA